MSWSADTVKFVQNRALAMLDTPYEIGGVEDGVYKVRGKPAISDQRPKSFDCSGFSRWVIGQGGITLPHGTQEQIKFCIPVAGDSRPLDLGFSGHGGAVDHVIIQFDKNRVIEARGPQKGKDYGKVIMRPVAAWERYSEFMGWWRVPGVYP